MARAGGPPPAMRVLKTVAILSPVDVNVTVVPDLRVNSSRTARNLVCSSPLQTAAISTLPPTRVTVCCFGVSLAHADAPSTTAAANAAARVHLLMAHLPSRGWIYPSA